MADTRTKVIITAIDQTKAGLDSVRNNLNGIKTAAAAVGLSFSAIGMVSLIKSSIDAADNLSKLAQKTGTTVEALAGLKFAADQNGTSLEDVAKAAQKLSVSLTDKPELFKKLGITAKDSTGALVQMADIFANMPDGAEKTALAVKLMGRRGAEMIPFLNQGSEALSRLTEEGRRYNPITAESAKQAEMFNDQLAALKQQAAGLGVQIAVDALPALAQITAAMKVAAAESGLLAAAWVALGGAGAALFTDEFDTIKQQIAALKGDLGDMERHRQQLDPGKGGMLQKWLYGTAGEMDAKIAATKKQIADLQAQLNKPPPAPAAPKTGTAPAGILGDTVDEYAKLQKVSADYIKSLEKETAAAGLDATQKKMLESATVALTLNTDEERLAVMQAALAWADATREADDAKAAQDELKKATEAATKAAQEASAQWYAQIDAMGQSTAGIEADTRQLRDQTFELLHGKAALEDVRKARMAATIATLQATLAGIDETNQCSLEAEAIRAKIDALNDYAAAQGDNAAAIAASDATQKQKQETLDMWKSIDQTAHATLVSIMNGGKNTAQRLKDAFRNSFFDWLYSMTIKKWVISVTASIGMTGVAQAGQAANTLSGVGDLTSGISNLTSVLGNFGNTVSNFLGITEMAGGMASMAGSTAVMSAAYTAPAIATSTAMGAAAGTGLMTTIGAALPWIGGALAVYSLFKGNGGTPTTSLGHAVTSFGATGQQTGTQSLYGGSSAGVDAQIMSMQTGYMKAAMALGIGTTAQQWGFAMNTGANGQKPMFGLSGGGFSQAETAQSDAAVQLAASRAVFSALQGSDLPQFLSRMFEGLTAGAMTQQDIDNTLAFAGSVKQMRDALLETRTPLEVLRANVDSGTAAFATSAATFRTDFVAAIDAGINPQVFEQWKALGTAIDQLAAADAELAAKAAEDAKLIADTLLEWQNKYAVLMGTTTERAIQWQTDLASTTDATTQSVINLYYAQLDLNDANTAAIALANQGTELSLRVMELEGAASSALAIRRMIELDALDASLRTIQQRIWALEDEAVVTEANAALVIEAENAIYEARRRNLDEAKAHVDAVFNALKLAVDTQRQALTSAYDIAVLGAKTQIDSITKSVGNLRSIADLLKSSVDALLPMSRAQAQAFIRASISAGGVGDSAKLKQSLEAISKPSEGLFGNFIDYQRDFMRTANDISTLSGITDVSLTAEERLLSIAEDQLKIIEDDYQVQMSILDGVILSAQGQIDAINGTTVAVMGIEAAMSGLASAIAAQSVAQAAVTAIPPPSTSFTPTVTPATMSIDEAYQSILGRAPAPAGREFWTNAFGDTIDRTELAQFLQGAQPELAAISSGTQDEWLHSMGVPGYAVGVNAGILPRDMILQAHGGEEITPRPFVDMQRAARDETNALLTRLVASNDDMKKELKAAKIELADIKTSNRRMMQTEEDWDINGTPAVRA